ncbi:MAG TPA: hypothetical protein VH165_19655 [Kofleriaceae bacterium]|jgi:hypothetical protein|nr:hypothetical protein [Kofleriaceae bacterium]
MRNLVLVLALIGCGKSSKPPPPAPAAGRAGPTTGAGAGSAAGSAAGRARPAGLTDDQLAVTDEFIDATFALIAGQQAAGTDCSKAVPVLEAVMPRFQKLSGHFDLASRSPEVTAWLAYRGRAKRRALHLRQPVLHCKTDAAYQAAAKAMPEDLALPVAAVSLTLPPAVVTDAMLEVTDRAFEAVTELTLQLGAAGGDCTRATIILTNATPAADELAKQTEAFMTDPEVTAWIVQAYNLAAVGLSATPASTSCADSPAFKAALAAYPLGDSFHKQ